jgi:hypothetical protein
MFNKLRKKYAKESVASYLGLLKHGNTHKLARIISNRLPIDKD